VCQVYHHFILHNSILNFMFMNKIEVSTHNINVGNTFWFNIATASI